MPCLSKSTDTSTGPSNGLRLPNFFFHKRAISASCCSVAVGVTSAFEELKKFEQVAETTRLNRLIAAARRETAAFDELGLRKRAS